MEVKVDNLAACKKKLSITIPRDEIEAKLNARFTELEREAQVPGFRPGRAPRRLVEKRFHEAVEDEVRVKLISEAFTSALKEHKIDVIGEPDIDPDKIQMPKDGPLTFSIDLEVRPEFTLPDYVGIPVTVEQPTVTDEGVQQALERLRESHGKLEDVPADGEVKENDFLTADLAIQTGETLILDRPNVRMPVAGIAVEGIRLECVPEMLKGAKAGETRTAKITIGQDAEKEDLRGKEVEVRIKVNEVRRVALPDDLAVLKETDYEDMDSLKGALRRQLEGQSDQAYREAQERAVQDWLLEKIPLDLPNELAERHANRILQRNVMNLQYRGVPVEEIEKQAMEIRSASTEAASRDLKLFFILDAIAEKENVEATDAEVDARIRLMAMQSNRKPDRIREEMEEAGTLENLYSQIVEDKVLRLLLEKAKIGGAAEAKAAPEVPAAEAPAAEPPAAPPAEEKPKAGEVEST